MKKILDCLIAFGKNWFASIAYTQDIKARKILEYYNVKFDDQGNVIPWENNL
jgi:hypothetical protein